MKGYSLKRHWIGLVFFASLFCSLSARAQIPVTVTTDLPSFINQIETMMQWAEQLKNMEKEFKQAENQFNETKALMTGNSSLGSLLNGSGLYDYLPTATTNDSWSEIYSSMTKSKLDSLREKYGMASTNDVQQEAFDTDLTNLHTLQKTYAATNKRLANIKSLTGLADSAATPQEKADIQARIALEQAAIQNDTNRMDTSAQLMAQNNKLMVRKQNDSFSAFLAGE